MLHCQLNPHFLFNTLNAISTLIHDRDTQLANTMVTRLSRFLRYSLDKDTMLKVTVAEEVEALKLYLDIEKVRFDDRLQLHFDIEPDARTALMPSLLLQPLVENSIKHAVSRAINGGSISIAECANGQEALRVIGAQSPDLVFLDIQMSGMDGLDLVCELQADAIPLIKNIPDPMDRRGR